MKKLPLFCLCAALLLSSGCAKARAKTRYEAHFLTLFDTVSTIVGFADSKERFTELSQQIYDRLEHYHRLYDIYHDYDGVNNLKTINDNAGGTPVPVDPDITAMLAFAKECFALTGGTMNVALGPVLMIWHEYRETGIDDPENARLPPVELLRRACEHCGADNLILDAESSTVCLKDPMMRLDVGSIAKGYAVEQTARYFESLGYDSLLLSVGGNVRAIGGKPGAKGGVSGWDIGIQNPDKESSDDELMSLEISGCSVVTSGSYERYYTVGGVRCGHIICPDTLMPADRFAAVTVVCKDSGLADALSTALYILPLESGRNLIENLDGAEALWVLKDGSLAHSQGFMDYVKPLQAGS